MRAEQANIVSKINPKFGSLSLAAGPLGHIPPLRVRHPALAPVRARPPDALPGCMADAHRSDVRRGPNTESECADRSVGGQGFPGPAPARPAAWVRAV